MSDTIDLLSLDKIDLALGRLRPTSPHALEKMAASLRENGQLTPIVVANGKERFLLVDGFKRYRAAAVLKYSSLKAVFVEADHKRALALTYLMNRGSGFSFIQEALLVRELVDIEGLTQSESALLLDRHKSWVSRRLGMIKQLLPDVTTDLLLELLPPGSLPSLARLPQCNQADFAAVIRRDQLTSGETRLLTDLFCKAGDPGIRQFILKHPRQALAMAAEIPSSRESDITAVLKILSRLEKTLPDCEELKAYLEKAKENIIRILEYWRKNEQT